MSSSRRYYILKTRQTSTEIYHTDHGEGEEEVMKPAAAQ